MKSGQRLADVRTEITRQVDSGALIKLDSVAGAGNRVPVPRVAYEMEKTIIRHIAEGKEAVQPPDGADACLGTGGPDCRSAGGYPDGTGEH